MKIQKLMIPALAVILLAGCQDGGNKFVINGNDGTITGSEATFIYESVTSIGLLEAIAPSSNIHQKVRKASQETLDQIEKYLPMVDAAFSGNQQQISATNVTSDRLEYAIRTDVTYLDVNGTSTSFTLYYNETPLVDDDDDDDWWEQEEESILNGILLLNEVEYKMFGEKELEDDEMELSVRYSLNENTYVHVQQEIEKGEQEFEYEVYQAGRKVYEYSLEMERDEVELKVLDRSSALSRLELKFDRIRRDGRQLIRAKISENRNQEIIFFEKVVDANGLVDYLVVNP